MPFRVGFSKGHSACTRVVSWLDQELPEKQLLGSLHMYCTHTGMYGISDFLFCSTRYEDPFWHKAQFISWLQHRLLEPERMLYFEGDAAGKNCFFLFFVANPLQALRRKVDLMTKEMLSKSMKTKQKLSLVVEVPTAEQILCTLP